MFEQRVRRGSARRRVRDIAVAASVGATCLVLLATPASSPSPASARGVVSREAASSPAWAAAKKPTGVDGVGSGVSRGTQSIVPSVPAGTGGLIRFLLVGNS